VIPMVIRIMYMQNAGWGNAHQSKFISPQITKVPGNFDKFIVNVNDQDENFIIFSRPKAYFLERDEKPQMNEEDMLHLGEIIYGTVMSKFLSVPKNYRGKLIVELDMSQAPDVKHIFHDCRGTNPATASTYAQGVMTRLLFDLMRDHARNIGEKIEFRVSDRNFTPDECKLHFFPGCIRANTSECCKVRQCESNQQK